MSEDKDRTEMHTSEDQPTEEVENTQGEYPGIEDAMEYRSQFIPPQPQPPISGFAYGNSLGGPPHLMVAAEQLIDLEGVSQRMINRSCIFMRKEIMVLEWLMMKVIRWLSGRIAFCGGLWT